MSNPLDPVREWYRLTRDCLRVTQRTARIGLDRAITDKHQTLFHLVSEERIRTIDGAQEALDRLAVVDLAAVFERALRTHLTVTLTGAIPVQPPFNGALRDQVNDKAERWTFEELVDLYSTADGRVRGLVKDVIKFRNWAAHGRHTTAEPAPSNVTPEDAYSRLTDFLTVTTII